MAFIGKATYSAGTILPELAEDVSNLIGIISRYETPLLDALDDPMKEATSTRHDTTFFKKLNQLIEKYSDDLSYEFKIKLLDIMKKPEEEKQYEFETL